MAISISASFFSFFLPLVPLHGTLALVESYEEGDPAVGMGWDARKIG